MNKELKAFLMLIATIVIFTWNLTWGFGVPLKTSIVIVLSLFGILWVAYKITKK